MTRRNLAVDAGLAALVLAVTLLMVSGNSNEPGVRGLDLLGAGLTVLSAVPLVARRAAPFTALLVTSAVSVALAALGYALDFPFGPLGALYAIAAGYGAQRLRRSLVLVPVTVLFLVASETAFLTRGQELSHASGRLVVWAAGLAGAWIAGDGARLRRERSAELTERAVRTEREAERERRLAIAEERTRIARELHDSAGHAINVILVQAGAARLLRDRDPEGSARAITAIEEVARATLTEIGQLVRALRDDDTAPPLTPVDPAALDELVESHRTAGQPITLDASGTRADVPRGVAAAIYRILQEALTNASRHGTGGANVVLRFGPDAVDATVTNPTSGGSPYAGGGHGIIGMRERATLLGGVLETATDGGVFRLHACLPYQRERP